MKLTTPPVEPQQKIVLSIGPDTEQTRLTVTPPILAALLRGITTEGFHLVGEDSATGV